MSKKGNSFSERDLPNKVITKPHQNQMYK